RASQGISWRRDQSAIRQGWIRLDRYPAVGLDRCTAGPDHGVTDQPVKLDRVAGRIDHPTDQISLLARSGENAGNGIAARDRDAVGIEHHLATAYGVDRSADVEIVLFADELGAEVLRRWANPVKVEVDCLIGRAASTLGAHYADLDLGLLS